MRKDGQELLRLLESGEYRDRGVWAVDLDLGEVVSMQPLPPHEKLGDATVRTVEWGRDGAFGSLIAGDSPFDMTYGGDEWTLGGAGLADELERGSSWLVEPDRKEILREYLTHVDQDIIDDVLTQRPHERDDRCVVTIGVQPKGWYEHTELVPMSFAELGHMLATETVPWRSMDYKATAADMLRAALGEPVDEYLNHLGSISLSDQDGSQRRIRCVTNELGRFELTDGYQTQGKPFVSPRMRGIIEAAIATIEHPERLFATEDALSERADEHLAWAKDHRDEVMSELGATPDEFVAYSITPDVLRDFLSEEEVVAIPPEDLSSLAALVAYDVNLDLLHSSLIEEVVSDRIGTSIQQLGITEQTTAQTRRR